eukprot:Ihof_evm5s20 gene=Ihof_evmTU5s20
MGGNDPEDILVRAKGPSKEMEHTADDDGTLYNKALYGNFLCPSCILLPGQPIEVKIVSYEKHDNMKNLEHFVVFKIELHHGQYYWTVNCRERDIRDLHDFLSPMFSRFNFKLKEIQGLGRARLNESTGDKLAHSPLRLANRFQLWRLQTVEERSKLLEAFLQSVVSHKELLQSRHVQQFFRISRFSFIPELGSRLNEGLVVKKGGGHRFRRWIFNCCREASQREQWLVMMDSYLFYVSPQVQEIRAVMLFDPSFQVSYNHRGNSLVISNHYRDLTVTTKERYQKEDWVASLRLAISKSTWTKAHSHDSFAPVRMQSYAHWFVDGRDYFAAVARAIQAAKEEIFIADWWLSPELYLKRPPWKNEEFRLDVLLAAKAEEGVKVCVMLYKNVELAVGINSVYSKLKLREANRNISVLRHPDHPPDGVWLWAHHEKIVVVDQRVGFLGGLDLCFGRDDTAAHELTDVYSEQDPDYQENTKVMSRLMFKVISASNLPSQIPVPPTPPIPSQPTEGTSQKLRRLLETWQDYATHPAPSRGEETGEARRATSYALPGGAKAKAKWKQVKDHLEYLVDRAGEDDDDDIRDSRNYNDMAGDILRVPSGNRQQAEAMLGPSGGNVLPPNDVLQRLMEDSQRRDSGKQLATRHSMICVSTSGDSRNRPVSDGGVTNQARESRTRSLWRAMFTSPSQETTPLNDPQKSLVKRHYSTGYTDNKPVSSINRLSLHERARNLKHWMGMNEDSSAPPLLPHDSPPTPTPDHARRVQSRTISEGDEGSRTDLVQTPGDLLGDDEQPILASPRHAFTVGSESVAPRERSLETRYIGRMHRLSEAWNTDGITSYFRGMTDHDAKSKRGLLESVVDTQEEGEGTLAMGIDSAPCKPRRGSAKDSGDSIAVLDLHPAPNLLGTMASYTLRLGRKEIYSEPVAREGNKVLWNNIHSQSTEDDVTEFGIVEVVVTCTMTHADPIVLSGSLVLSTITVGKVRSAEIMLYQIQGGVEVQAGSMLVEYMFYQKATLKAHPVWVGKDYSNPCTKDFFALDLPEQDSIDRLTQARMPWHDAGIGLYGQAARDVARHYIERWNHIKVVKCKEDRSVPYLLPRCQLPADMPPPSDALELSYTRVCAQILRSSGMWTNGIAIEHSIQNAYISAIKGAKHYIYIENQFFITALAQDSVYNQIGNVLFDAIVRAHGENRKFRVYIIMPLMPAFEGTFGPGATSMQIVMYWQFRSINRGVDSLLSRLTREIGDWSDYITFNCLQKYEDLCGQLVTNQIYVHSKLMVVDDRLAICGSANINDRSMLGSRDSEIATVIQDHWLEDGVDTVLDGQPYKAGRFCYSLRKRLFGEHLELGAHDAGQDIVSDTFFYKVWLGRARSNTAIYQSVFRSIPNSTITSWEKLEEWREQPIIAEIDREQAENELHYIQGHLVDFPYNFLEEEYLGPVMGTM